MTSPLQRLLTDSGHLPARDPSITESEAVMLVLTKMQMVQVIRRAYGSDLAESLAASLPDRIDLDNAAEYELLSRLGLNRDNLFNALGAEL